MKKTAHQTGLNGERVAVALLRLKGYSILKTRYKTPYGEIDIIATTQNVLVCVEVKTRKTFEKGISAVLPKQRERIINSYLYFCQNFGVYDKYSTRFDVVVCVPGKQPLHLEQAFEST